MFGYVRPAIGMMTQEEKTAYQSAYCGLCHTLGRRHGWLARFTLNYDFAFLALLHYAGGDEQSKAQCRCPAHPFRKKRCCLCGAELETAADQSIILMWYKLCDDVADHGLFAGLPYRLLKLLFRRAYHRAAWALPRFERRVRDGMERLNQLEGERSGQLDRVADTFAGILTAAASDCGGEESRRRAMEQLLYQLGRWIYLTDAWDDLDEDVKKGRYNAMDARFQGGARQERDYVETTMTHSLRLVSAAAELIEFGPWRSIVENILYTGLPTVQSAVLDGRWKELRKQGRNIHERPV